MIPTRWFDAPAYIDPTYEPVWAACAEAGLVLHTHSGAGPADYPLGPGLPVDLRGRGVVVGRPAVLGAAARGVFERHPELKYSIAENGAWWVPDIVTRMDEKWEGAHNTRKFGDAFRLDLSMQPSDYVDRNCSFAASTPGVDEIERRHAIGVDNLLWGNDLPHPEGTYPHTRKWITERFRDVPEDETRRSSAPTPPRSTGSTPPPWPTSSTASARPPPTSTAEPARAGPDIYEGEHMQRPGGESRRRHRRRRASARRWPSGSGPSTCGWWSPTSSRRRSTRPWASCATAGPRRSAWSPT